MVYGRNTRALLITFDAFNTLYTPKATVAKQYVEVAKQFGIRGIAFRELEVTLKSGEPIHEKKRKKERAIKLESKLNPNYGRESGRSPDSWWTSVIFNTFKPHLPSTLYERLDPLAKALLKRFSSREGYKLYADVIPFLRRIGSEYRNLEPRKGSKETYDELAVGVISNSDDRVLKVLPSLGLPILDRASSNSKPTDNLDEGAVEMGMGSTDAILDFVALSYDVGHEKPSPWIFCNALATAARREGGPGGFKNWTCVHVGDDFQKDLLGASRLGWRGVLLQRGTESSEPAATGRGFPVISDLSQLWDHLV